MFAALQEHWVNLFIVFTHREEEPALSGQPGKFGAL